MWRKTSVRASCQGYGTSHEVKELSLPRPCHMWLSRVGVAHKVTRELATWSKQVLLPQLCFAALRWVG